MWNETHSAKQSGWMKIWIASREKKDFIMWAVADSAKDPGKEARISNLKYYLAL